MTSFLTTAYLRLLNTLAATREREEGQGTTEYVVLIVGVIAIATAVSGASADATRNQAYEHDLGHLMTGVGDVCEAQEGQRLEDERGQATTEFVLILPALLLVLFAIIQFGGLYNHWITLTDATRRARTAAVSRASCPGNTEQAVRGSASSLNQADTSRSPTRQTAPPGRPA